MIPVPLLNPKFAIGFCRTMCANFGFGALVRPRAIPQPALPGAQNARCSASITSRTSGARNE